MKVKVKLPILYGLLVGAGISAEAVTVHDLTAPGTDSVNVIGVVGGTAIISDHFSQPTGTGVFQPFTDSQAKQNGASGSKTIEQGYNSNGNTYLDAARAPWNHLVTVGDLASVTVNGSSYYAFVLDSNEAGNRKSGISLDNIRIYTSASDTAASASAGGAGLANLGTLRWAMNNAPTSATGPFNVDQWVNLDSSQENALSKSNGGSGKADLIAYIPTSAFNGASASDYLWFYNLMGVKVDADSGFEEWSYLKSPGSQNLPDGGATAILLGTGFLGLAALRKTQK